MRTIKKYLGVKQVFSTEEFIQKAKEIHGDKFDYSKTIFVSMKQEDKMVIECDIHGEFNQGAYAHLAGHGCTYCGQHKHTQKSIISLLTTLHPTLDFSKVIYENTKIKVPVTCTVCNHEFNPTIGNLKDRKSGCPKCANNILLTTEEFVNKCKEKYGTEIFNYDDVDYSGAHNKVKIKCLVHDKFFKIKANTHLVCGTGCGKCCSDSITSSGVKIVEHHLNLSNIDFEREYVFSKCKNILPLRFDFYLPEHNICIEYDGAQHFKANKLWGGDEGLKQRQFNDEIKNSYCKENNIILIRISYKDNIIDTLNTELKKYM